MKHHEELVKGLVEQLKPVFENSQQSIYLYLDNTHKWCNQNFSRLLGYSSPEEWSKLDVNFPEVFVSEKSRKTLVGAYQKAMDHMAGSTVNVAWKRKNGKEEETSVILVPISYQGHTFALHFIAKKA